MNNYIKKNFIEYLNERYLIDNLPKDIVLLSKYSNFNNYDKFLLYDINLNKAISYIEFIFYKNINSYIVVGAYSKKGYGAFLYECAMTYVYPIGLSMSRDSTTSDDALNVWFKFKNRNDVKKQRMYSDEITHKKQDWIESGFLSDKPEYRQSIFDLEDIRFYYNFGKEKLNNLIQIGRKYMKNNDISEQKIEYMSWDLEN